MKSHSLFANLTVLELASVLAGPSVGQFFAELGARVIKVENTRTEGDVTRHWRLVTESKEGSVSSYFACCNWGKASVALNLKTASGQQIVRHLAQQSDIVLASYKPGDAERLGVDWETLRALNERLIYGHITGYGTDDSRAGYDAVIQAESGFMFMNGSPDGPLLKMPVALMDVLAAHQLKQGLLVALLERSATGQGCYVHVALRDAALSALANQATNWLIGRHVPQRMGAAHPNIAPYGTVYSCSGGEPLVLAVGTDAQFRRLCAVLALDGVADDPRFTTNAHRVVHREALNDMLHSAIAPWERDDLLPLLQRERIPAGAVYAMPEVMRQPGTAHMMLGNPAAQMAAIRQVAYGETVGELASPPGYAEHTATVLMDMLGFSADDIARLERDGAVVTRKPRASSL